MTPSGVSRWLRNHSEAIEASEGLRVVCRAVDETGSMSNLATLDLLPPYSWRELSRDLCDRCADGAPDADKVRIHLHLVHEDARTEFTSKVFKTSRVKEDRWSNPSDTAIAKLMGQFTAMNQLLVGATAEQYELSIRSQECMIAMVHEVAGLIVSNAETEAALAHVGDHRSIGDRVADVAELAVAHQIGIPLEKVLQLRAGETGIPEEPGPPVDSPEASPDDLDTVRRWVQGLTPEELRAAITKDPVISVCVAKAWNAKA